MSPWKGGSNFLESWQGIAGVDVSCALKLGGFHIVLCHFPFEGFEEVLYGSRFAVRKDTSAVCW